AKSPLFGCLLTFTTPVDVLFTTHESTMSCGNAHTTTFGFGTLSLIFSILSRNSLTAFSTRFSNIGCSTALFTSKVVMVSLKSSDKVRKQSKASLKPGKGG